MKKKVLAGNWKMSLNKAQTTSLFENLTSSEVKYLIRMKDLEILVAPSQIYLDLLKSSYDQTHISILSQNISEEPKAGAFTGEISVEMLAEIGVAGSIVGHSERRQFFGETNEKVNLKLKNLLDNKMKALVCIGEDLQTRQNGNELSFLSTQINECLKGIDMIKYLDLIYITYEPIWAISTSAEKKNMTIDDIEKTCKFIQQYLYEKVGVKVKLLFGGSVNPDNISTLSSIGYIDGFLVGSASTDFNKFLAMINLI